MPSPATTAIASTLIVPPTGATAADATAAAIAAPIKRKNRDDSVHYQYTIEVYELGKDLKLKLVKQVPLMKDKDNTLIKAKLMLKRASFVTNGKIMLMIYKRQMHFFDLATGIRLSKSPL